MPVPVLVKPFPEVTWEMIELIVRVRPEPTSKIPFALPSAKPMVPDPDPFAMVKLPPVAPNRTRVFATPPTVAPFNRNTPEVVVLLFQVPAVVRSKSIAPSEKFPEAVVMLI